MIPATLQEKHHAEQELPVGHFFAPNVYAREIFMPSGMLVIGHQHRTEHLNIVLTGSARVLMNGVVHEISAPFTFRSGEGVRKVLYILEDCRWMTIHATQDTDPAVIESKIIDKEAPIELVVEELEQLLDRKACGFVDVLEVDSLIAAIDRKHNQLTDVNPL